MLYLVLKTEILKMREEKMAMSTAATVFLALEQSVCEITNKSGSCSRSIYVNVTPRTNLSPLFTGLVKCELITSLEDDDDELMLNVLRCHLTY